MIYCLVSYYLRMQSCQDCEIDNKVYWPLSVNESMMSQDKILFTVHTAILTGVCINPIAEESEICINARKISKTTTVTPASQSNDLTVVSGRSARITLRNFGIC